MKLDNLSWATRASARFSVRETVLPTLGFYPKILGYFRDIGIFLGIFQNSQKIILNINFLILINLLVCESYPVINIIG